MVDKSILIFAVSALVSACAVLSALGFRGRVSVIGVDLGTTFSVVAVSEQGRVRVFRDEAGEALTPSAAAFAAGGRVLVGREALRHGDARHVIYDAKRFIGRRFADPSVAAQAGGYSFSVVRNGSETAFALEPRLGHGPAVSPEEVGAHVVRRLKALATTDLGHGVRQAVMCVPAGFGPEQIRATGEAFKRAGLGVARVMPEPVAAACAYGLQRKPNVSHVLVYDFGGGTLDVSVLYVRDGSIEVVTNGGDNDLGGTDFDHCIADSFPGPFDLPRDAPCDDADDLCAPHVLLRLAEQIKIDLTDATAATRTCRAGPTCDALRPVSLSLDRDTFQSSLCAHLFDRALKVVHHTLSGAMIDKADIDEVVLVGGTSRIPHVRNQLRAALQVDRLNTEIDPDVTVAVGAASILD
mmetsp:Transcript_18008/g.56494  ORF Transcript_18008/g.56494 Transcript_18008/m.56494 type:complete len:410 (-) Transcript_18008:148-1377(-)